jgi:hypothetical protein
MLINNNINSGKGLIMNTLKAITSSVPKKTPVFVFRLFQIWEKAFHFLSSMGKFCFLQSNGTFFWERRKKFFSEVMP